tara:strand:+ start:11890 stop:12042 length:153 start_codon:yes stop_codon:yes gene_type:complete
MTTHEIQNAVVAMILAGMTGYQITEQLQNELGITYGEAQELIEQNLNGIY